MATRMYLVELKRKNVLVEAASQESAIQKATASMVKSVSIPTPLEVARMMRDNVEVIANSVPPLEAKPSVTSGGEVGRLGIGNGDGGETEVVDENSEPE